MRLVLYTIAAIAAAEQKCGPPPDAALQNKVDESKWCLDVAPSDLWACEAAIQRRLLSLPPLRHGCAFAAPSTTAVTVGSRNTVPHAQTWADLRWASYAQGVFRLHDPSGALFRGATLFIQGAVTELGCLCSNSTNLVVRLATVKTRGLCYETARRMQLVVRTMTLSRTHRFAGARAGRKEGGRKEGRKT